MRNRKDTIDHVQNFVLLLLSLSALILLFRLPLLSGSLGSQLQNLLTAAPVAGTQQQAQDLTDLIPSVHLVATGDSEYGRYSHLYLSTGSAAFLEVSPLLGRPWAPPSRSALPLIRPSRRRWKRPAFTWT